jgi:hypothetical protein
MSVPTDDATTAWHELLELVKNAAEARLVPGKSQEQLRWISAGTLALMGQWQVQARFLAESGNYEIRFERFGAQLGASNFEFSPGTQLLGSEIWRLVPEKGITDFFWRVNGAQVLSGKDLAKQVVEYLPDYYHKYRLAAIGA